MSDSEMKILIMLSMFRYLRRQLTGLQENSWLKTARVATGRSLLPNAT